MTEKRTPILVTEAIKKIEERLKTGETESVSITNAHGRYLAEDLVAKHPVPAFDRSPYDGFAFRAIDTHGASFETPKEFKVIEALAAGYVAQSKLQEGEVIRIMTGAPIPEGADAVQMLELTETIARDGQTYIRINRPLQPGENISKKGEDTAEGSILAEKGRRISAGEIAMLATFGYAQIEVYKQPVVGIYATGSELLPVDAPLEPGKIRNSNSYMIESQIKALGAIPKFYGILSDEYDLCFHAVKQALKEVDILITTGGASVGDFDHIQDIIHNLNAEPLFNKVAMRPGSVTTVAYKEGKWIFGLSGNPAACFVGFELFTRPVLRTLLGSKQLHLPRSKAILNHDLSKPNSFTRFIRAKIEISGFEVKVSTVGLDKSGIASALVEANGLLIVPAGGKGYQQGDVVEVIWLERPIEGNYYV